jgi:flagellar biosynthesis/type III secretory pathway M-ring protein FliF/YscJ
VVTACSGKSAGSSMNQPSNSPTSTNQDTSEPLTKKNPESTNWEVTSRVHYTQGLIMEVHTSIGYTDALTVNVEDNYRSNNDPSDSPPFKTGEMVTFKLLTMVNESQLKLKKGTRVIINNTQFTPKNDETPFWGGDIIGYEKDNIYYDLTGKPANFTFSKQASLKEGKIVIAS